MTRSFARPVPASWLVPVAALALAACASAPSPGGTIAASVAAMADSGDFVTRLGADTLVVERFVRTPRRVEADVVLRVPQTTRTRWVLALDADGMLERMDAEQLALRPGAPVRRESIVRAGDSLRVEVTDAQGTRARSVAAPAEVLPFIDMVHWPYEVALVRMRAAARDSVVQPLLTGARTADFRLARIGGDSVTVTHPFRGTMRALTDARGRLLGLDAGATTRKLVVVRQPAGSLGDIAAAWAAQDAAGRPQGALSGRAETREVVAGANIVVDYGTPAKRGRAIWGALVPWGRVWRTGANQATHLTTDRDLVLGSGADTLRVPAGRYTLFSIPESGGGTLIVSRATDIAGTAYDPAHDLGRVRLTMRTLPESIETFTIAARPAAGGGELALEWDRAALVVPFRVR
jgi:hypothetical protein